MPWSSRAVTVPWLFTGRPAARVSWRGHGVPTKALIR